MLTSCLLSRSSPPQGRSRPKQLLFLLPPIVACGLPIVALWNTWMFWREFPISGVFLSPADQQSRSRTSAHRNRSETLHCPGTEPRSRSSEEQLTATPFSSATSSRFDMPDLSGNRWSMNQLMEPVSSSVSKSTRRLARIPGPCQAFHEKSVGLPMILYLQKPLSH